MKLSTTLDVPGRLFGEEDGIRKIAEAGFDAFDMSLFRMFENPENYPLCGDDYRNYAKRLRAVADDCGIVCNQSHAPFASSTGDPAEDERRFAVIVRAMEIAAILGAKNIVVHPKQHLRYSEGDNAARLEELNMAFYRRLIPYAEEYGVRIAVENMWQRAAVNGVERIWHSTCSTPAEFCRYMDRLDSPWIVGCLDIGHVSLVDGDIPVFIRALGCDRLQCLHVHDTDGVSDLHTLPYFSKIDYDAVCRTLREIGYTGDITLEADNFFNTHPLATPEHNLRVMHAVGRELCRLAGR
ncbi:MAG: sugar phosphate isomerase/epimerase [Ruminococcaceae bacterium]|nr:sugar phosphate isomerase/epimerase [Oscillospiraceae bacterium]